MTVNDFLPDINVGKNPTFNEKDNPNEQVRIQNSLKAIKGVHLENIKIDEDFMNSQVSSSMQPF